MAKLEFKDFLFEDKESIIRFNFLKIFYFDVSREEIEKIGQFKVDKNTIEFENLSQTKAERKFPMLLQKNFKNLKNKISKKSTVYIHKNSKIPLIGTTYFGIIDRGTNLIEVRPITSCNLGCIFCSVDEGPKSKKKFDFVVEADYLIEEFKKLAEYKEDKHIDAHINSQGEPLLYSDMVRLVSGLSKIPTVKSISIDSNGTFLNEDLIDRLKDAGLTRINLSLHAMDKSIASDLAGAPYDVERILKMAEYIAKKMDIIIVPVWVQGYNDDELEKLVEFAKKIGAGKNCPPIGIQNFLNYQFGRNPAKEVPMDTFYQKLRDLESKCKIKLICDETDFKITKSKEYPKPFKKGQTIKVSLKFPGRIKNEMMGIAGERMISIPHCYKKEGSIKIKIKKTKHNLFVGELIG